VDMTISDTATMKERSMTTTTTMKMRVGFEFFLFFQYNILRESGV
jgi:hypothetical protein